jgi:hypothetical protein
VADDDVQEGRQGAVEHLAGETHGKVVRKLTSRTKIGGTEIAATKDDPRYLVESDKTGKVAAHKPDALERRSG